MSVKSYAQLLKLIKHLIATGATVSDPSAGTPAAQIHEWINSAEYCLSLLEDTIPTGVSEFRQLRQRVEFKVEDDEGKSVSASAYTPKETDLLLDFSFEHLKQATEILKLAAKKLEIKGDFTSSGSSDDELRKKLYATRRRAGHTQEQAAEKIGCDSKDISQWETGKVTPQPKTVKTIYDYIDKYSKPGQS